MTEEEKIAEERLNKDLLLLSRFSTEIHRNRFGNLENFERNKIYDSQEVAFAIRRIAQLAMDNSRQSFEEKHPEPKWRKVPVHRVTRDSIQD